MSRVVWLTLVFLIVTSPGARAKTKIQPCPGGRWSIDPHLIGTGTGLDGIVVTDRQVAIDSGCPPINAKRKITKKATVLTARWKTCGTDDKSILLVVKLDTATCHTLSATFKKRKSPRQQLTGVLSGLPATQAELDAIKLSRPFHDDSPEQKAADAQADAALTADDQAMIDAFLSDHPEMTDHYTPGTDPDDPSLQSNADGNFVHTFKDSQGTDQVVITLGAKAQKGLIGGALHNFPTLDNQMNLYGDLYKTLQELLPDSVGQFETPDRKSVV